MGDNSGISWTDATWNPIQGCSRTIAAGAKQSGCGDGTGGGCYAERTAGRFCGPGQPYEGLVRITAKGARWTGVVRMVAEHLADPLRWRKPRRIFVNSMSDLFHEELTNEQIAAVFGVMAACPQHTFQILTKRAKRMREWFEWLRGPSEDTFTMQQRGIASAPNTARALLDAAYEVLGKARKPELDAAWHSPAIEADPWPLRNVHLGVSTENQPAFDERWPELFMCPAAVRWFSAEPLIGGIDMTHMLADFACKRGKLWLVAGCESGPGARPADPAWFRSLRDQCSAAGVPYFLKQAVAHSTSRAVYPSKQADRVVTEIVSAGPGSKRKAGGVIELPYLDGVQHCQFPEPTR